ncbi:LamG domain-containing protein [Granulicella sp. WH15]|uniref:LamG domain-containing protein n=1 Tax=Granulicella sp. WH15 TaxID=2602070 RepID=UPI001366AF1A|nr:LamG domain-containing protein [Granulicella sp. WH15]QHN03293.1 LamG domain-containing protein [Granulicella sp. WH15]
MKLLLLACALSLPVLASAQQPVVWSIDSLNRIGGATVTVVGSPRVVDTELGKAVHFEGKGDVGDALFVDAIPLVGTLPYTWEMIFRPSSKGGAAQRIFHLQEAGSENRRLFELRIVEGKWCLDSFAGTSPPSGDPPQTAILLKCDAEHLFPLDQWYAVAAVYDGKVLRHYVNGILQGETQANLQPLGKGGASLGTRYNKKDFFTGDIFSSRFTARPLAQGELMRVPSGSGR